MHFVSCTKIHVLIFMYPMNSIATTHHVSSQKKKKAWHRLLKIMCQNRNKLINVLILLSAHPGYLLTKGQTVK